MGLALVCWAFMTFLVVSNGVAVEDVTKVPLRSGEKILRSMPIVGLGTWQVTNDAELEAALDAALEAGYRHIDTATRYKNEHIIGRVLKRWLQEGKVKREELFITTKLPPNGMRCEDVSVFLQQSLEMLQLEYVDLYLVHMPFGYKRDAFNGSSGHVTADSIDITTNHSAIWRDMEAQHRAGRAKALGLSNFNETQIERIMERATVQPANLQVELHLYHQQKALVEFCKNKGIVVTAYSPIGSPGSTWVSRKSGHELPDLLGLPAVREIALHHNKTTAQVLLRHTVQRGIVVIPKSSKPERIRQNIDIFDFTLDEKEMAILDAFDKGFEGKIFDFKHVEGSQQHPEFPWTIFLQ